MSFRGRHWVAIWLLVFLAVAWLVIARQTSAIRAAGELTLVRAQRADLEGHRIDLERRIRAAQSRAVLVPRARQRLGLRLPADTEIILLPVPAGPGGPP